MRAPAACGTRKGYDRHRRHGEEPCTDCRAANAAYMKDYRSISPAATKAVAGRQKRRDKALRILGGRYPDELDEIVADLEAKEAS